MLGALLRCAGTRLGIPSPPKPARPVGQRGPAVQVQDKRSERTEVRAARDACAGGSASGSLSNRRRTGRANMLPLLFPTERRVRPADRLNDALHFRYTPPELVGPVGRLPHARGGPEHSKH